MSEQAPKSYIAYLNDQFRRTCDPFLTPSIAYREDRDAIVQAVRDFDGFTPDNDPWKEHDMGGFDWEDTRVLWKLDYYDAAGDYLGNPADPNCNRVLTIMEGGEY